MKKEQQVKQQKKEQMKSNLKKLEQFIKQQSKQKQSGKKTASRSQLNQSAQNYHTYKDQQQQFSQDQLIFHKSCNQDDENQRSKSVKCKRNKKRGNLQEMKQRSVSGDINPQPDLESIGKLYQYPLTLEQKKDLLKFQYSLIAERYLQQFIQTNPATKNQGCDDLIQDNMNECFEIEELNTSNYSDTNYLEQTRQQQLQRSLQQPQQ